MAKGNMLLGYSRGSVGDVVFYRDGGTQRQRARNRNPNNPKTEAQQAQRSKFANAVKFFKQVNSNFFRFAFEDKKPNESDYNAFMRHNVSRSGYIGYAANKLPNWPALGLWQLSDGSLPEITAAAASQVEGDLRYDLGVSIAGATTVGNISQLLENSGLYREGDILTFVAYICSPFEGLPTTNTSTNYTTSFAFTQFIIDTQDTRLITDIKITSPLATSNRVPLGEETADGYGYLTINIGACPNTLTGFAIIHSRNTSSGLLVSPAWLAWLNINNNGVGVPSEIPVLSQSSGGSYYNSVLADWDASQQAILQGAASRSSAFHVLSVRSGGTSFSKNSLGQYVVPLSEASDLLFSIEVPAYVPASALSVTGETVSSNNWNIAEPLSESLFTGKEVFNLIDHTWTAGVKTINVGSYGQITLLIQ